ncbi:MAG: HupE/UreJ family protein [Deltaproteobacteria bacterium]|nr:HupE/UreJ family protein [Deltaproteobacteria bacterium]
MARFNRILRGLLLATALALGGSISAKALAHPLAPSLLEITERGGGESEILWKTPISKTPSDAMKPLLPEDCRKIQDIDMKRENTAYIEHWRVACEKAWAGSSVGVQGFSSSQPNVIVRIVLANGLVYQQVLNTGTPSFIVPERPQVWDVFKNYFTLGVKHILTGWDHLLFVLGLVLLVRGRRQLLWTITAFTFGHSITLSSAVLGWVHIPSAPVEALIAFSILILAVELLRKQDGKGTFFHRYPWALAFSFGLLHGLGFAGALAEVGLPVGEIPMALFSFNVGIESGQLLFIAGILLIQALLRPLPLPSIAKKMEIPAYGIGCLASFWFFERLAKLWDS